MSRIEFFSKIEDKYNIGLKKNRPIIIRLDARNTTKNKKINLLNEAENSFSYSLKKTCEILTKKYSCMYIYVACDEVNIIIFDTIKFLKYMKSNYAQEIICSVSQEFSYIFHKYYKERFILFAGRAFSCYKDNLNSYLIYRKHTNASVLMYYYLRRIEHLNITNMPFTDMYKYGLQNCENFTKRTEYQINGIVYYRGKEFSIEEVLTKTLKELLISKIFVNNNTIEDNI